MSDLELLEGSCYSEVTIIKARAVQSHGHVLWIQRTWCVWCNEMPQAASSEPCCHWQHCLAEKLSQSSAGLCTLAFWVSSSREETNRGVCERPAFG